MLPVALLSSRRVVGAAILTIASVACSDGATSPRVAAPTQASPIISVGQNFPQVGTKITVRAVDVWDQTLTEPAYIVIKSPNPDSVLISDNGDKDLDPTVGVIKAAVAMAPSYHVCAAYGSKHYQALAVMTPPYPSCVDVTGGVTTIDAGKVYFRRKPQITWHTVDAFGQTIIGAGIHWERDVGGYATVYDGQVTWDEPSVNDGYINYTLPAAGNYSWCEIKAPVSHDYADPKCGKFTLTWEGKATITLKHEALIY